MTQTRKRWISITGVALLVLAGGYLTWALSVRANREGVVTNALVGRTEAQVRAEYGEPDTVSQGYQSLGAFMPRSLPEDPIRTLIFYPRGPLHPEGGTLWVWFVEDEGGWRCFESCWFADGVVF
ncbi:MAG: hypothetical protein GC159_06450 [Phycisphaera sp.]|nr:hypothetical protein [Phycisphaera sp.]